MTRNIHKVLIADDEPKIRRGLSAQIERMELPLCVCGMAEDGERAIETAEKEQPDIMLVDINMPFMNGLELIRALRRTRANMRIIVVTGYEDFDYAKTAFEGGAQAYLLKPVEPELLRRELEKAIQALDEEQQRNRHFEWAIAQISRRQEYLCEKFLHDAVSGELEADEIRDFRVYFDLPNAEHRRLMLVICENIAEHSEPWQRLLPQAMLREVLHADSGICFFTDERGNLLLLYNAQAHENLEETVKDTLLREMNARLYICSKPAPSIAELSKVYDSLIEMAGEELKVSPVVEAAKRVIAEEYICPELSLEEVSKAVKVNATYLSRLMKAELGMSFSKYLTNVRIGTAIRLMQDPNRRIREISESVGYRTSAYFSAAFKKAMGMSPAEYREGAKHG